MKQLVSFDFKKFWQLLTKIFIQGNISSAATVIAYYSLLAIFPMIIFIGNILPLLDIKSSTVMPYLAVALPKAIYKLLAPTIKSFLDSGSGSLASISGVLTIWAASRGINAAKRSFNFAYGVAQNQSAILTRVLSFILTICFGALVGILLLVFSFGQMILEYLMPLFNISNEWLHWFTRYKWPTTFIVIFIVISISYYILPNAKLHWRLVWPGALLATLGWMILTQGFSLYVSYFARSVLGYGALGTFIVLLLWLHFSSWVTMIGAVFNATLEYYVYGEIEEKTLGIKNLLQKN